MKLKPINLYSNSRRYLANHKKLPYFLSHGGIHLLVLILLLVIIGFLGYRIYMMSVKNFVIIDTSFQFVNEEDNTKYPLRYFNMTLKADSIENKNTVYIDAYFDGYHEIKDKPITWTWIYTFPNSIINYNYSDSEVSKKFEDKIKTQVLENGFRHTFISYDAFSNSGKRTSGNLLAENELNPYYCALIRFSQNILNLDSLSTITIDLSKSRKSNTIITFDEIIPKPSEIGVNKFSYKGKEIIEEILHNGEIFFEAKDTVKAYRADKYYLLFSVLIGTLIAFCLDIIIKLIYKWRGITDDNNPPLTTNNEPECIAYNDDHNINITDISVDEQYTESKSN